jgi:hypothetical protein
MYWFIYIVLYLWKIFLNVYRLCRLLQIKRELMFESQLAEELFSPCLPHWLWNTLRLISSQHPWLFLWGLSCRNIKLTIGLRPKPTINFLLINNLTHFFIYLFISPLYTCLLGMPVRSSLLTGIPSSHLHRLIIPDNVLIQFDLLMMSTVMLETCR